MQKSGLYISHQRQMKHQHQCTPGTSELQKGKEQIITNTETVFTIHKTNQALQKVRTQKTCGETWRANFLNLPPPADGWEIYFRTVAAYRFPGISDIHYDSRVLKNKLGGIICSRRHRWYMGGTSYYWMYRSLFPCLGKHLRRVAPGTGCRGQMRQRSDVMGT